MIVFFVLINVVLLSQQRTYDYVPMLAFLTYGEINTIFTASLSHSITLVTRFPAR